AYNGWRLRNEHRGGHIPGARSIPLSWTAGEELGEALSAKDLDTSKMTIIYGYEMKDSLSMADALHREGFNELSIYPDFSSEWLIRMELPCDRLQGYRKLVHPDWLSRLLSERSPEYCHKGDFVLCHAHYRNPEDYFMGHIPGAVPLDTLLLEEPEKWNRRTPDELEESLCALGIDRNTTVILYGRYGSPDSSDPFPGSNAGQIAAMRCAFIMLYAGVDDVRILNGGIMAWERKGFDLETTPVKPVRSRGFGGEIPVRREIVVDIPEAREILDSDAADLVSVRSWKEYIGEVSGYNYFNRAGRIPGAVFGDCGSDAYHMENFRNPDHTMREYGEIERNWIDAGLSPERRTAFYCGTGWRASEAFFSTLLLGWKNIAVFDGGWMEWSSHPENPVATGVPGKGGAGY
ncbi:MAG: thiosulfate sulfurtransferase, partial [Candidatus Aegiribacteria sp.]|nr:thiosulfate sulfurtransferase [Candidatus Aegiribacteria sp.]MBD3294187.1 thiosulfate sulfurtransferase [Candidatus Fermentibacteria bacterium]